MSNDESPSVAAPAKSAPAGDPESVPTAPAPAGDPESVSTAPAPAKPAAADKPAKSTELLGYLSEGEHKQCMRLLRSMGPEKTPLMVLHELCNRKKYTPKYDAQRTSDGSESAAGPFKVGARGIASSEKPDAVGP